MTNRMVVSRFQRARIFNYFSGFTRLPATAGPARVRIGRTDRRSTSAETERCSKLIETTNRCFPLTSTRMPSIPVRGPRSMSNLESVRVSCQNRLSPPLPEPSGPTIDHSSQSGRRDNPETEVAQFPWFCQTNVFRNDRREQIDRSLALAGALR
jgi:hypothetical protein